MKKSNVLFLALFITICAKAQSPSYLIGSYWTGSTEVSRHLNYSNGVFTNLATLTGVSGVAQGETAYDAMGKRYFIKTNLGISVIDAQTGTLLSTISTTVPLKGIEYNSNTGNLIGSYWTGSAEIFASVNINTGAVTNLATLPGVTSVAQGETAFDAAGNRYFMRTGNPSIQVINASTGAIINTINNNTFKGIQFSSNIGELIGSYWTGSAEVFASLDVTSGVLTNIGTLMGVTSLAQGESTYDAAGDLYFNKTNFGITVINAQNGVIINTVPGMSAIKGIEFIGDVFACNYTLNMNSALNVFSGTGSNAVFLCSSNAPSPSYQWQSNPANFGWLNIPNNASYSGVNGPVLTVNNVSLQNHLQKFRVLVSAGTCVDTSLVSTLHISDTCITSGPNGVTGMEEALVMNKVNIQVYPNPASNYLIIDIGNFSEADNFSVKISNNVGQELFSQKLTQKQIRVDLSSNSSKGIYYLQILDSNNTIVESKKIIIR